MTTENPKQVRNTTGAYGVINEELKSTSIPDNVSERGAGLQKLASSMPSAMARLFIFDSALKQVNDLQAQNPQSGHNGEAAFSDGAVKPTAYHDLVGELLDMLEFIYEYGDNKDFHVRTWVPGEQLKLLKASESAAHRRLAKALEAALSMAGMPDTPIHLFLWGKDIIGGTAPTSLVFTSANLRTRLGKNGLSFKGKGGNTLFADEAKPLHQRHRDFQKYVYSLWQSHMTGDSLPPSLLSLRKYISDSADHYDVHAIIDDIKNNKGAFDPKEVKPLTSKGQTVTVKGIPLMVSNHTITIDEDTTDYMLKPTADYYANGDATARKPLALTPGGVDGLTYAAGREWKPGHDEIPAAPGEMDERMLPGLNVKWPYLTTGDFLEDRIIKVSYFIDRKKFFTGNPKALNFLLPLRKEFFLYFKPEDLFKVDPVSGELTYSDMLTVEYDEDRETVTVNLRLPLASEKTINFFKKYDVSPGSDEMMFCADTAEFDLAVFPFYRLVPDNGHNVYDVMIGAKTDEVTTSYWIQKPGEGLREVPSKTHHRLFKGPKSNILTDHVNVDGAFSMIELEAIDNGQRGRALLLPIFRKVTSDPAQASSDIYTFAVDFGTTNTHVAYFVEKPGTSIGPERVRPFTYDASDTQLVTLNDENGAGNFGDFMTALFREAVPFAIGGKSNVKFPMRTVTYEKIGESPTVELFANTNIGFNYGSDLSRSKQYMTNIKWDRHSGGNSHKRMAEYRKRMAAYFEELLWMMKNKSALNNCTDSFNVVVTYTISMSINDLEKFKQAWEDARKKVKCTINSLKFQTESIAPYYAKVSQLPSRDPFVNVDIGGGTTDMLYVNPSIQESQVFSALFAADDLWNDGVDPTMRSAKANGFLTYFKEIRMPQVSSTIPVKDTIEAAQSSADVISYLFTNNDITQLGEMIEGSKIMKQLLVVHFGALMYFLAYAVHMAEVAPPRYLTFSGMGSKYIKLINGSDEVLSTMVNAIFRYAGSAQVLDNELLRNASVKVSFDPNPKEITATGSLVALNYPKPLVPIDQIVHGYEEEDPGRTFRMRDLTKDIEFAVIDFYKKFVEMFRTDAVTDTFSDAGCPVTKEVAGMLEDSAQGSFDQVLEGTKVVTEEADKLTQPMFFWPLKGALYNIGKELAQEAVKVARLNS